MEESGEDVGSPRPEVLLGFGPRRERLARGVNGSPRRAFGRRMTCPHLVPVRPLTFLALLLVATGSASAQSGVTRSRVEPTGRYRVGDDVRWAEPEWDDSDWERAPLGVPPDTAAVVWLRVRVTVGETDASASALGLAVLAVAAREVYWDGVFIGRSGRVGADRASEVPGPIDALFPVPDSLSSSGPHVVAVRMSTFRRPASVHYYVQHVAVGDLRVLASVPLRAAVLPLVFLGGFVLIGLYVGVLWATDRRRPAIGLTALLCLAVAALVVAESWRAVVGYDYDLHLVRLWIVTGLTCTVGWLLLAVFVVQFGVSRGWAVLLAVALGVGLAVVLAEGYDGKAYAVFLVSLVAALAVTLWGAFRRRSGAGWALAGVVVCLAALAATGFRFMDGAFFPAFGLLTAGMLASLGLQTRDERRRHAASRAVAARLEAELLRKHLQPHFLMNTLTSIVEWVETDPATGARALEALADELRALAEVSGETRVPMRRELALCRAHLDVMGYRRDVHFELGADGVDGDGAIPPAVLHTLVENAVTHNAYGAGTVRLVLREERQDGRRRLVLQAPLAGAAREDAREGGGLRYVRARLEEAFPGRWSLSSGVEDGTWTTRIELPAVRAEVPVEAPAEVMAEGLP